MVQKSSNAMASESNNQFKNFNKMQPNRQTLMGTQRPTNPLFAVGFVKNKTTCVAELNAMLEGTDTQVSIHDVIRMVSERGFHNRNAHGYPQESDGTPVCEVNTRYKLINTGLRTKSGEEIIGWFTKGKKNQFEGITWGTEASFKVSVSDDKKFRIGDFVFDEWENGLNFLEDIATSTIPETWSYQHAPSGIKHPILKSYIENIFNRLKQESKDGDNTKIIYSQDGKWMMFNTNLLDKFFNPVIIVAEVRRVGSTITYFNPQRSRSTSDRLNKTFTKEMPTAPKFFENVNEVVFQTQWSVDDNFDKYTHIIEDRRNRFPKEYADKQPADLALSLDKAIRSAIAITQRNYKFVVPMYRPQTNTIQLLMPIYLQGTFQQCPDFALVLTPDPQQGMYTPETILPLDAAYQNARLIAKPDETWLNPANI